MAHNPIRLWFTPLEDTVYAGRVKHYEDIDRWKIGSQKFDVTQDFIKCALHFFGPDTDRGEIVKQTNITDSNNQKYQITVHAVKHVDYKIDEE